MKRESKYASCLNALDEMQQSVIYTARKGYLAEAESIIVRLESETAEQRAEIDRLKIDHTEINVEFNRLNEVITQQMGEIERLQAERDEFRSLNEHHKEQFLKTNLELARGPARGDNRRRYLPCPFTGAGQNGVRPLAAMKENHGHKEAG